MKAQPAPAQSLSNRIFSIMARLNLEPSPINYELLHEVLSGNIPELREKFAKLGKNITPPKIEELAREYLPHHFGESIFDSSADTIRDDLEDLLGSIKSSQGHLSSFSSDINQATQRMARIDPTDTKALRIEIDTITQATARQTERNTLLMGTMDEKLASISAISQNVDEAQKAKFLHAASNLGNRRAFNKRLAELYLTEKFPSGHTLVFGHIRNFELIERGELLRLREAFMEKSGQIISAAATPDDFCGWLGRPSFALLLATSDTAEVRRTASKLGDRLTAQYRVLLKDFPAIPELSVCFGGCSTFTAQNPADLIAHAESALAECQARNQQIVLFGESATDASGRNYSLYGRPSAH